VKIDQEGAFALVRAREQLRQAGRLAEEAGNLLKELHGMDLEIGLVPVLNSILDMRGNWQEVCTWLDGRIAKVELP
jgi:hypothetical protein